MITLQDRVEFMRGTKTFNGLMRVPNDRVIGETVRSDSAPVPTVDKASSAEPIRVKKTKFSGRQGS